jgi:hypothetical protein
MLFLLLWLCNVDLSCCKLGLLNLILQLKICTIWTTSSNVPYPLTITSLLLYLYEFNFLRF